MRTAAAAGAPAGRRARSDVATDVPVPTPPFWGDRIVKGLPLADYAAYLDERATFLGQWGLKASRSGGPSYEELVETEGRPRLRAWLDRVQSEGLLEAAVVYGYFPCVAEGDDLVVLHHEGPRAGEERARFTFPRQRRDRRLCLADYFRPRESGETDVVGFHVVTMGSRISDAAAELFANDAYREYLELHGLSVQLTEALAEYWHRRVREELASPAPTPTPSPGSSSSSTRASGTPSATRPARTSSSRRCSSTCWRRVGSAWSCPRSSSCTRSSPPAP